LNATTALLYRPELQVLKWVLSQEVKLAAYLLTGSYHIILLKPAFLKVSSQTIAIAHAILVSWAFCQLFDHNNNKTFAYPDSRHQKAERVAALRTSRVHARGLV
jgi:hypothetical protein